MADTKLSALTELAATPANDDEVYIRDVSEAAAAESKRITITNLMAAASAATKEFFCHPTIAVTASWTVYGDFGTISLAGANHAAYFTFKVPSDFSSITNAEIIVIPLHAIAFVDLTMTSDYGAVGEAYNANSESVVETGTPVVDQLYAIDVSGTLSSLAADDYVGIKMNHSGNGAQCNVIGIRFKYG